MYTTPKILWLKENMPEAYKRTHKILQSNSFVVYRLTNVMSQDISQCYGLHCFNMHRGQWDSGMCFKWAVQHGHSPIPFSVYENEYFSNLQSTVMDPLTDEEMEKLKTVDANCRLIKGQVFLWPGANDWHDLWDGDGTITK